MHYIEIFSAELEVKLISLDSALSGILCTLPTKDKIRKCFLQFNMNMKFPFFNYIFLGLVLTHHDPKLCILWPLLSPSVHSKHLLPLPIADNAVFVCQCVIDCHPPVLMLEQEEVFFLSTRTLQFRVLAGMDCYLKGAELTFGVSSQVNRCSRLTSSRSSIQGSTLCIQE